MPHDLDISDEYLASLMEEVSQPAEPNAGGGPATSADILAVLPDVLLGLARDERFQKLVREAFEAALAGSGD